jgi:hypothetical protein
MSMKEGASWPMLPKYSVRFYWTRSILRYQAAAERAAELLKQAATGVKAALKLAEGYGEVNRDAAGLPGLSDQ